jgi:hypothetical protein
LTANWAHFAADISDLKIFFPRHSLVFTVSLAVLQDLLLDDH